MLHCSNCILSINCCLVLVYVTDKSFNVLIRQASFKKVIAHLLCFKNIYDRSLFMYVCVYTQSPTQSLTSTREKKAGTFHLKSEVISQL